MSAVTAGVEEAGLDGFGGVLFADEDLQEAELGLDPLVLPVLLQVRHPVLLLHVPARGRGGRERGEREGGVTARHQQISCVCSKAVSLSVNQSSPDSITLRADYMIADSVFNSRRHQSLL